MELKLIPKNKKAFLARTWMISFVVGVAVMALGYLMVQGMATEYDQTDIIDTNFKSTYDKYDELSGNVQSMLDEARGKEGLSIVGTFTVIWGATTTIIQLVFSSLLLPGAMLRQFAVDIGAPLAIANIIFTLPLLVITIVIVLVIISFIGQGKM